MTNRHTAYLLLALAFLLCSNIVARPLPSFSIPSKSPEGTKAQGSTEASCVISAETAQASTGPTSPYADCYWNITILPNNIADVEVEIKMTVTKEYTVNISVPILVEKTSVNMTGMDSWQWIEQTSIVNILQGTANFSTPNSTCQVRYQWPTCLLYTNGRSYFGQVESWLDVPQELQGQVSFPIDTTFTIDIHETRNETIQYAPWAQPSQVRPLGPAAWRVIYANYNLRYLPQLSYVPNRPPSREGLVQAQDTKCHLTLPAAVNESSLHLISIISELFDQIQLRTTLLPPRNYLDVLFLPDMLFSDIYYSLTGDIYAPLAFYAYQRMQVLFRAGSIFPLIADYDWGKALLVHEFTHAFMHDYCWSGLPSLLVEGFAQYYEWEIYSEWGHQSEYQQHLADCKQRTEDFRLRNNGSLQSVWSWKGRTANYDIAHYIVAFLANDCDPQAFSRFFSIGKTSLWYQNLKLIGSVVPENVGWGLFAYCLGLAAGKPMEPALLSLDCPLFWYPTIVIGASLLLWGAAGLYALLTYAMRKQWVLPKRRRAWIIIGTLQIMMIFSFSVIVFIVVVVLEAILLTIIPKLCHSDDWWESALHPPR